MCSSAPQPLLPPSRPRAASCGPRLIVGGHKALCSLPGLTRSSSGSSRGAAAAWGPLRGERLRLTHSSGTLSCLHPQCTSPSLRFQVTLAPLRRWKGRQPVWAAAGMWAQGLRHLSKARVAPGHHWWPCPDLATSGINTASTDQAAPG